MGNLMLAQAQSCFAAVYAQRDPGAMSPHMLSKLHKQAAAFYALARAPAATDVLRAVLDRAWASIMAFQGLLAEARAQFWRARALLADAETSLVGYGEAVARFRVAAGTAHRAVALAARAEEGVPAALRGVAAAFEAKAAEALRAAEADNNGIYHEVEAPEASLAPLAAARIEN